MSTIERPEIATLTILHYPDKRLRVHAAGLPGVDGYIGEVAHRMGELMLAREGVGLAATQVGWPYRLIVVNPTLEPGKNTALINPKIVEREGRIEEEEGCLSVPGVRACIVRAERVKVRAMLLTGEEVEFEGEGLASRLFQHELDHLEGRLFVDRVPAGARNLVNRRLKELARGR